MVGKRVGWITLGLMLYWLMVSLPDGKPRLIFCDVGQGDAAIVAWGSFQAVIDTGANFLLFEKCLREVMPFWDRKIEILFVTHDQKDHSGAVEEVKKRYKLEVEAKGSAGDVYRFREISFEVVGGKFGVASNEDAGVLLVRLGGFSALLTSDIGAETESFMAKRGVLTDIDILKVAHHGSKYSTSEEFLDDTKPELAVISVGKNTYGHPSEDVLGRLRAAEVPVLRTDIDGEVRVEIGENDYFVFLKK